MTKFSLKSILLAIIILLYIASCSLSGASPEYSNDPIVISTGQRLFKQHCSTCHQFKSDGIGPALGGITSTMSIDRLASFIRDPQKVITSGDRRAVTVSQRFSSVMPGFTFTDNEMRSLLSFLNTNLITPTEEEDHFQGVINDPVPLKITLSNISVNLELLATFPTTSTRPTAPVTRITKLDYEPGSGHLFVCDLRGTLYTLKDGYPVEVLNIRKNRTFFIDEPGLGTGLGSFAFHPEFERNRLLYTTHTEKAGRMVADFQLPDALPAALQWVLTEWKLDKTLDGFEKESSRELLRMDMISEAHGVQEIAFNKLAKKGDDDYGLLYMAVGDGGSVQLGYPYLTTGKNSIWGKVIRIDPLGHNSRNLKYGIPQNNPLIKDRDSNALKEVYAYGFRNPHRFTWLQEGDLMVSNIGQANIESIYKIAAGDNCGWPFYEGSFRFDPHGNLNHIFLNDTKDSSKIRYPVLQYDHHEGSAIAGGMEYCGSAVNKLTGNFIFGDIPSGRIFYTQTAGLRRGNAHPRELSIEIDGKPTTLEKACNSKRVDLHFGRDSKGEIYLLTKSDGRLYRIKSAMVKQ